MHRLRHAQRGMTLVGVLIGAVLVVFFVYSGAKLTPIYLEYYSVKSSLNSLTAEEMKGAGTRELRDQLLRRLQINNVQNVKPDNINIRAEGSGRVVTVDYEVRTQYFGNLWLLASFSDQVEVTAR
jgi:hypothetical protein